MKFLGVMILIGVYKSRSENTSKLWIKENGRPIFREIMNHERYQQSLRILRFDDANARKKQVKRQITAN